MKTYIVLSKAWYGKSDIENRKFVEEVNFGIRAGEDGNEGCIAEAMMRWYDLHDGKPPSAKLEIFDDSFAVLTDTKLVERLSQFPNGERNIFLHLDQFCRMLEECGYIDATPITNEKPAGTGGEGE